MQFILPAHSSSECANVIYVSLPKFFIFFLFETDYSGSISPYLLCLRDGRFKGILLPSLAIYTEAIALQQMSFTIVSIAILYHQIVYQTLLILCSTVHAVYMYVTGVSPVIENQRMQEKTLDLFEGSPLNYSCELIGPRVPLDVVACLTRNKSDKIEQINRRSPGDCVHFSDDLLNVRFNTSLMAVQTRMYEDRSDYCSPRQLLNFFKEGVSLGDDELSILSGLYVGEYVKPYCSVHLNVRRQTSSHLVHVVVGTGVGVAFILVVLLIVVILTYRCYRGMLLNCQCIKSFYLCILYFYLHA